jgi:hypothetical protein
MPGKVKSSKAGVARLVTWATGLKNAWSNSFYDEVTIPN